MEFDEQERENFNSTRYHFESLNVARSFSKGIIKEIPNLVKSIVIFGSVSLNQEREKSDVDILIILDNISVIVSEELKQAYYLVVNSLVDKISHRLHITTMNLTDFWDLVRKGDPVVINILRTGYPLYDESLFEPVQFLLKIGKIKPTLESLNNYQYKANDLIENNKIYIENALSDLYYAIMDLTHSVLILHKEIPSSPDNIKTRFEKVFKGTKLEKYSQDLEEFYNLYKNLEYKKIEKIDGKLYDKYFKKAQKIQKDFNLYISEELKNKTNFDL